MAIRENKPTATWIFAYFYPKRILPHTTMRFTL